MIYKRLICMFFVLGLFEVLKLSVLAKDMGYIQILPKDGETSVVGGSITLRHVGTALDDDYLITGRELDFMIAADEVFFPETAILLQKHAVGKETVAKPDENGIFYFDNLKSGLYLLVQSEPAPGYTAFAPFLVELPIGNEIWHADVFPEVEALTDNPQTGDRPVLPIATGIMCLSAFGWIYLYKRKENNYNAGINI